MCCGSRCWSWDGVLEHDRRLGDWGRTWVGHNRDRDRSLDIVLRNGDISRDIVFRNGDSSRDIGFRNRNYTADIGSCDGGNCFGQCAGGRDEIATLPDNSDGLSPYRNGRAHPVCRLQIYKLAAAVQIVIQVPRETAGQVSEKRHTLRTGRSNKYVGQHWAPVSPGSSHTEGSRLSWV